MRYYFTLVFLFTILSVIAEDAFIDYRPFYYENEGYSVYDVKGKNNTWFWQNRSILVSNEFEEKNDNNEYPESEDWLVFGPYDLSNAKNVKFAFDLLVSYGSNAITVNACTGFPGYNNEITFPGNWETLLSQDVIAPNRNEETRYSAALSQYEGQKDVYVSLKFAMPLNSEVWSNQINRIELTREVPLQVKEIEPTIEFNRQNDGVDFYNIAGTEGDNSKWSIRTGYAKATSGNNVWLVMRSFDLSTSGDAFFSFQSQILSGNNGPVGLEIKVANVRFNENSNVNDIDWIDYPKDRIDHRIFPADYFSSGMLDLSDFMGDWVTVAFRFINPQGEQYNVKDFRIYHLPDVDPPVVNKAAISRLVYNKAYVVLNANERATAYWAIHPSETSTVDIGSIKSGVNATAFGSVLYDFTLTDTIYPMGITQANTSYNLFLAMVDFNDNTSAIQKIPFITPNEDLIAPQLLSVSFSETNNYSTHLNFKTSEPCVYSYLIRKKSEAKPSIQQVVDNGLKSKIEDETDILSFYNLDKDTEYVVYWVGIDYSDNQSELIENNVRSSNDDLDAPVIELLELNNSTEVGVVFNVSANEAGKAYYVVQNITVIPPGVSQLINAVNAKESGQFNYEAAKQNFQFTVNGLENNKEYFCYVAIEDNVGNVSMIKVVAFSTSIDDVPVVKAFDSRRLIIDREAEFNFEKSHFQLLNNVDVSDYYVHVLSGENYAFSANKIVAADNFTGGITVPVCLTNGTFSSNVVDFKFIVDYQTVKDSLAGLRRNMVGGHLNTGVYDMSTNAALLDLQSDGAFFTKPSNELQLAETVILGGRMINIATHYYNEKFRSRKAKDVRHKMYKAIEYWIDNKAEYLEPDVPLLWPNYLGAIMLPFYDDMMEEYETTPSRRDEIDSLLLKVDAFNKWCWAENENSKLTQAYSGTNLANRVWGTLALAAVTHNVELSFEVYDTLVNNLKIQYNSSDDFPAGIMADGSFTANNTSGAQWNWYAYGLDWLDAIIEYARISKRTHWRLPKDKVGILGYAITNGAEWLHWNDLIPSHLTGKYFSDNGSKREKNFVLNKMNEVRYESFLNNVDLEQNDEIFDNYEAIQEEFYVRDSSKYFWNSNALIHSSRSYISTLFMPSNRTGAFETGLDTIYGLKNTFVGDGAVFSYNGFGSYSQRHLLDYRKLPGTTVERRNIIFPYNLDGKNGKSLNDFAGGVSDGQNAACGFYYNREVNTANVNAYKSYFFFSDFYVALGTGINKASSNKVYTVGTTVEQDVLNAQISYSISDGPVNTISSSVTNKDYEFNVANGAWFQTGGKGYYVFPDQNSGTKFKINIEERIESWDLFNGSWKVKEKTVQNYRIRHDTANVFSFEIEHGKEFTDAQYAYMVTPAKSDVAFTDLLKSEPITILSNSIQLQAVRNNREGIYGIAFIEAGDLYLADDLKLSVDKPAFVLLKENDNGLIEAWVSDPYQKEKIIEIKIVKTFSNKPSETTQRLVALPGGINKGAAAYTNNGNIWAQQEQHASNNASNITVAKQLIENYDDFELKIYPVPASRSDLVNIDFNLEHNEMVNIVLVDAMGRKVYQRDQNLNEGIYKTQLDISQFRSGVHWVKIIVGNKALTRAIMIK